MADLSRSSSGKGVALWVFLVALLSLPACSTGHRYTAGPPTNDPEFSARLSKLAQAYEALDADRVLASYDPKTYTLSFDQPYKFDTGIESHRSSLEKFLSQAKTARVTLGEETKVWKREEGRVWTFRDMELVAELKNGDTFTFKGQHSAIWEKSGETEAWLIAYEHFWGDPKLVRAVGEASPPAAAPAPPPSLPPLASKEEAQGYLKDIFFDLDKYDIRPDQRSTIDADIVFLKKYPTVKFTIEGHCDDRATRAYNMKLGTRRAEMTRDYMMAAGIDASRIAIVTMGKERPFVKGTDDDSRQQNRRSHFVVTSK